VTELVLALDTAEELFAAPDPDPLAGRFETESGMDRLVDVLTPSSARAPLTLELRIAGADPGITSQIRTALAGYVDHRVAQLRQEKRRIERRGLTELVFGLLFLGVCLALSGAAVSVPGGPAWLGLVIAEGLVIVGWIVLWHPVDMLLFERWPLRREIVLLRAIAGAQVRVTAA
jgi:hypothetical protein